MNGTFGDIGAFDDIVGGELASIAESGGIGFTDGAASIAAPIAEPAPLTGIAAKGEEIAFTMLGEEIGNGWRFGDALTLIFQIQGHPPSVAARMAAHALEAVLHNAFVKAKILPYDQPLPENRLDAAQPAFVSNSQPEESGP